MIKMKTGVGIIFAVLFLAVFSTTVHAQPQIPIQIYGSLDRQIPDGLHITFKVGSLEVGSGTISGGKYGYDPVIFIQKDDPLTTNKEGYDAGDSVGVFINNVPAGSINSLNGASNNLNLSISQSSYDQIIASISTPPVKNQTKEIPSGGCLTNWTCTAWSACNAGQQIRTCSKGKSYCYAGAMPAENQGCTMPPIEPGTNTTISNNDSSSHKNPQNLSPYSMIILIVILVVLFEILLLTGFLVLKKRGPKTADAEVWNDDHERLKNYIIDARRRGYNDDYLIPLLKNNGWSESDIGIVLGAIGH